MKLSKKRRVIPLSLAAFAATLTALSGSANAMDKAIGKDSIWIGSFGRIDNFSVVDRDELILWASPNRPYLVEVSRPFRSLRFARAIGVTDTVGRITTFDQVIVDGQRLPIRSIQRLDRKTAKALTRKKDKT